MARNKKFFLFAGICIIVAVLYFIFPFDTIPDLITLVGWLDDLLVGVLGVIGLAVNILWALGVLPAPGACEDSTYEQYGEYREV